MFEMERDKTMEKKPGSAVYGLLILILFSSFVNGAEFRKGQQPSLEVRVLVDVSARMKVSDPDNRRVDALKLFIKLLPNKAQAGIWMFDGMTTEVIKPAKSGIGWKDQALKNLNKVHSTGKTGDIERALAVASLDWVEAEEGVNRHIVLLTDGKITSGSSKKANEASKGRVLLHQVERLKAAGVSVHAVGFTDDADLEFLEAIASGTSGWFDQAKFTDQLERAMLRVSKRLVNKNNIPLVANKFVIDDSIRQFTAVVFRKKGFGSTQLDDPEGMDFGRTSQRSGVEWYREKKFDIVTVTQPMAGTWRLIAAADPGNEVFISSNLQMAIEEMPKEIIAGNKTRIRMLMTDRGKLLKNSNMLGVIHASLEITNKRGDKELVDMVQDMITGGYFFADIGENLKVGPHELVLRAKANTFERVENFSFRVKAKPKVDYVEIKPVFKDVLSEAGVVIPPEGVSKEQVMECPDLSKIVVGGICELPKEEPVEEESNWMLTSGIVLLVNLLLAAAGFFGLKFYKKKVAEDDELLVQKLAR